MCHENSYQALLEARSDRDHLVRAIEAAGVMPDQDCCLCNNQEQRDAGHVTECLEVRAVLDKIRHHIMADDQVERNT